ncbi:putative sodium-dependent multivitamin transporter [Diachasmimorpha longicaudata]|uniref:putative sodium-dependent multivitamin transporter n=1 Tax=Diachasmimorpha longicaudata TaxID=58733 RepID=UPI0030B8AA14
MEDPNSASPDEGFLHWPDWLAIGVMLAASAAIGVYYRFTGGKQKTAEEYFTANHSTGVGLLSIAMMVAFLSAISLLGSSGENYTYGCIFNLIYGGLGFGTPIVAYFYLPVFWELQVMSVFEYLERRFGVTARLVASLANFLQTSLYTGVVIYAPSLALEATTGLNGTTSILLIGLICTFYSTIGGIKAVIITDLIQGALMYICVFCVIGVALSEIDGGVAKVIEVSSEGGRINFFNFHVDPTERHTFWSLSIGGTFFFLSLYATSQVQVQRMLTAKSIGDARKALFINIPLTLSLTSTVSFSGLVLYTYYHDCDPVLAGKIKSHDMIMPYFAKERMTKIPSLTGIFISGVFSASLSTVSAVLNSLAAIALSDYVKPIMRKLGKELPDNKAAFYGKMLALSIGFLSLAVAFLASTLGSLIQAVTAVHGAIGGPILGLFTLGMFFEDANETGAVVGTIFALAFNMWVAFSPKPAPIKLPLSIEGCPNSTLIHPTTPIPIIDDSSFLYIHRLSYLWYTPIGLFVGIVAGYIASLVVRRFSKVPISPPDPSLFTPLIAARIRRRCDKEPTTGSQVFVLDTKKFDNTDS